MKNSKLILIGLLNAFGVAVYVAIVSFIMQNGQRIFGKMDNFLGPIAFLLLFVLSAAITGALILGRPVILYFEGSKKEAVKLFICTIGWLFLITLIVFMALILR